MRSLLILAVMLCACATVAFGQPSGTTPPVPPAATSPAPPQPTPPPLPSPPPSPTDEFLHNSPEVALLLSLPKLIGRPLVFVVVFLFIGLVFTRLAHRIVLAGVGDTRFGNAPDAQTMRRLAVSALLVWAAALFAASEAAELHWIGSLVQTGLELVKGLFALAGAVVGGAIWVIAAALIAYAVSPRGRDFVLGLLGWLYLRYSPSKPKPDQEFDLGGDVRGRIVSTDFLHSTMQAGDGHQYVVPNAWLTKTHYRWGEEAAPPPSAPPMSPG